MKKVRTLIVDDEELARKNLAILLSEHCPQVDLIGEAASVREAKKFLEQHNVELLLLDIEMPNGSGFDLLESLNDLTSIKVIFITAYHEYALKAFKYAAVDYLLKPINIEELENAVNKVQPNHSFTEQKQQIEVLMGTMSGKGPAHNKIALPSMEGLHFVELDEIIYCESQDNYTQFYLKDNRRIMVSKTIKHFEDLLDANRFFRIHRSHIINLSYIEKYVKGEGGYVVMKQGQRIPVSRRRKDAFLHLFQAH